MRQPSLKPNKVRFLLAELRESQTVSDVPETPTTNILQAAIIETEETVQNPHPTAGTSRTVQNPQPIPGTSKNDQNPQPTAGTSSSARNSQRIPGTSKSARNPQPILGSSKTIQNPQPIPGTSDTAQTLHSILKNKKSVPKKPPVIVGSRKTVREFFRIPETIKWPEWNIPCRKTIQKQHPVAETSKSVQKPKTTARTRKPIPMLQPIPRKTIKMPRNPVNSPVTPTDKSKKKPITAGEAIERLNQLIQAQPPNEHWIFPDDHRKDRMTYRQPILFRDLVELEFRLEKAIAIRQFEANGVVRNREAAKEHTMKTVKEFFRHYLTNKSDAKNGTTKNKAEGITNQSSSKTMEKPPKRLVLYGCRPADNNEMFSTKCVEKTTLDHKTSVKFVDNTSYLHDFFPVLRRYLDLPNKSTLDSNPRKKLQPPQKFHLVNWHNRVQELAPKVSSEALILLEPPQSWSEEDLSAGSTNAMLEILPIKSKRVKPFDAAYAGNFNGFGVEYFRPVSGRSSEPRVISFYQKDRKYELDTDSKNSLYESVHSINGNPRLRKPLLKCVQPPRTPYKAEETVDSIPEPMHVQIPPVPDFVVPIVPTGSQIEEIMAPRQIPLQHSVPDIEDSPTIKNANDFLRHQYNEPDDRIPWPSTKLYASTSAVEINDNLRNLGLKMAKPSKPLTVPRQSEVYVFEALPVVSGVFHDAKSYHSVIELRDLQSEPTLQPMSKTRDEFEDKLQSSLVQVEREQTNAVVIGSLTEFWKAPQSTEEPSQEPSNDELDGLTDEFKAYLQERARLNSNPDVTVDYSGPTPYEYLQDFIAAREKEIPRSIMPPFSLHLTSYFVPLIKKVLAEEIDKMTEQIKPLPKPLNKYDRYCAERYPKAPVHVKVPFRNAWELLPSEPIYYRSPSLMPNGLPNLRQGPTLEIHTGAHGQPVKIRTSYEDKIRTKDGPVDKNRPRAILRPGKSPVKIPDYFDQGLESALLMVRKAIKSATPVKLPKVLQRPDMLDLMRRRINGEHIKTPELKYRKTGWKPKSDFVGVGLYRSPRQQPIKVTNRMVRNTGPKVILYVVNGKPMIPEFTFSPYHLNTYLYPPKTNATTIESREQYFDRCTLCYPCELDGALHINPTPRNFCVTLTFPDLSDSNIFFSHDMLHQNLVVHAYRKESKDRSYVNVTRYVDIPDGMDVLDFTIYRTDVGTLIFHDIREERFIQDQVEQEMRVMNMTAAEVVETYGPEFFSAFVAKYQPMFLTGEPQPPGNSGSQNFDIDDDADSPN